MLATATTTTTSSTTPTTWPPQVSEIMEFSSVQKPSKSQTRKCTEEGSLNYILTDLVRRYRPSNSTPSGQSKAAYDFFDKQTSTTAYGKMYATGVLAPGAQPNPNPNPNPTLTLTLTLPLPLPLVQAH